MSERWCGVKVLRKSLLAERLNTYLPGGGGARARVNV